ncbi:amino acid permease [Corynebacterium uberis]|uniref:amino acid permease n=1 Tax=Corynebacterium TaxID=1716 RepID=UPI001D0A4870|nr:MULTISPECIES: amino acid permease [Corynebacterium]MCZ9308951.1 amino acid permease [Corynebacterium sp. c6VSa_13]UDL74578.1 amino acid permease [Corynebacterium uberis]UDL76588.1 amino acid permease [Corynebacterium uberis]UDL78801.1 amino acid permease [Corynebacterium uberis]UDL81079.1 amino acid permease [Corynebacterium uberis]
MTEKTTLGSGLKTRHLTMMGLGSSVGAGLFLGTGVGIRAAGPAILLAYLLAGLMIVMVMQMLGEMASARPASGAFSAYARQGLGHWAGFTLGWLYWFMLIMVLGAEMTGAAAIMGAWFGVDPWIPALICVVFFAVVNLGQVKGFGEFEFWFAFIKVAVIIGFLVVGVALIFGWLPGHPAVGLTHIRDSGFMPNGWPGMAAGLLAVAFAFGGIEIVTIAAAESHDPQRAIATAVRSIIWRISLFYLGSVVVICFLMPFSEIRGADSAAESPFTTILTMTGAPGVVGFMELIIVLALLSAFNAQIYASSRLCYSLALEGDSPRMFAVTSRAGVPINSVIMSMFFAFVSVGLQWWNPPGLLDFLLNAVGGCLVVIWLMICGSYLRLHPKLVAGGELSKVRMWGHPWLPWATVAGFVGLVVLMLFDSSSRAQIFSVSILTLGLAAGSLLTRRRGDQVGSRP